MRGYLLAAICTPLMLCAPFAGGQVMPPSKPVPELGYKVAPGFFEFPPNWVEGEAAGVALNSKGHIFLFQRTRPMLSEFDEKGHYLRSLGEGLFDDVEHAEQLHLGQLIFHDCNTHSGRFSCTAVGWLEGTSVACSAAPPTYRSILLPGLRTMSRSA